MNAFRHKWDKINQDMSADDCVEVFLSVLKGESDLDWELFEELCSNYGVDFEVIARAYLNRHKLPSHRQTREKK